MKNNAELPEPWYPTEIDLTKQFFREMPKGHVLSSKSLKTIGRRQDNDDVLFKILDDYFEYAVVHLTWSKSKQKDSNYPKTKLYKDWDDLYNNRILIDKQMFLDED